MYTAYKYKSPAKMEVGHHSAKQVVSLASLKSLSLLEESIPATDRVHNFLNSCSGINFEVNPSGDTFENPKQESENKFKRKSSLRSSIRNTLCKCLQGSKISYQKLKESVPNKQSEQNHNCDLLNCFKSAACLGNPGEYQNIPQSFSAMDKTNKKYQLFDMQFKKLRNKTKLVLESTNNNSSSTAQGSQYHSQTEMEGNNFQAPGASDLLEMSLGESVCSTNRVQKMYQVYTGQIHLSIIARNKTMKIKVNEAKDLPLRDTKAQGVFVKVCIQGKPSRRKLRKTATVYGSSSPSFDKEFSYDLKKKDYAKRLIVTVYRQESNSKTNKLIGCTSYSIQNILKMRTLVDGWYYLLSENLGEVKHMQVTGDEHQPINQRKTRSRHASKASSFGELSDSESSGYSGSQTGASCETLNEPPSKPSSELQQHRLQLVKKEKSSYGFTLTDGGPAMISNMKSGSPAEMAGLKPGDHVIRINGESVKNLEAESVGKIIKHYPRCIILDVLRMPTVEFEAAALAKKMKLLTEMAMEYNDSAYAYSSDEDC